MIIRPPDVTREGFKFYPWTFCLSVFLSVIFINYAQQPRSRWSSNVFRRFGRRKSFNNWYRDLAHHSPNFQRGQKVRNLASLKHHSTLILTRLKMRQGICNLKQISCVGMIALCLWQVWWSWVHASM